MGVFRLNWRSINPVHFCLSRFEFVPILHWKLLLLGKVGSRVSLGTCECGMLNVANSAPPPGWVEISGVAGMKREGCPLGSPGIGVAAQGQRSRMQKDSTCILHARFARETSFAVPIRIAGGA